MNSNLLALSTLAGTGGIHEALTETKCFLEAPTETGAARETSAGTGGNHEAQTIYLYDVAQMCLTFNISPVCTLVHAVGCRY